LHLERWSPTGRDEDQPKIEVPGEYKGPIEEIEKRGGIYEKAGIYRNSGDPSLAFGVVIFGQSGFVGEIS
jgi:hypothetical protein